MESVYPVSMEKLDQGYGYILYESQLKDEGPLETLRCGELTTELTFLWMKSQLLHCMTENFLMK